MFLFYFIGLFANYFWFFVTPKCHKKTWNLCMQGHFHEPKFDFEMKLKNKYHWKTIYRQEKSSFPEFSSWNHCPIIQVTLKIYSFRNFLHLKKNCIMLPMFVSLASIELFSPRINPYDQSSTADFSASILRESLTFNTFFIHFFQNFFNKNNWLFLNVLLIDNTYLNTLKVQTKMSELKKNYKPISDLKK